MIWIILGIIVAGVAAWLLLRNKGAGSAIHHAHPPHHPAPATHAPAHKPAAKTWGKMLVIPAGAQACQAAHDLEGKAFPDAKLPTLPLAGNSG